MNLVTGATGHIGNVLVRELLAKGQAVRALVFPNEDRTPLDSLDVEFVEGDVLDYQTLYNAFQGIEHIYHLAGIISIMPGKNQLVNLVNISGTRNVLHAARVAGVKRLVYTSSIHALRRVPHGILIDEAIPFDPINAISAYDHSKAAASLEVLQAIDQGLDAVIACPTGVIGPFDFRLSEMGQIILDCIDRKPQLYVEGAYDFVDVRDVANGLIASLDKGRTGETYILSGENISIRNLIETVLEITGRGFARLKIPMALARFAATFTPLYYRLTGTRPRFTPYSLETVTSNSIISHDKARQELEYAPRSLRDSLSDTVRWLLENKHLLAASI